MPSWSTTLVRIFLAWEAVELVLVGLAALFFYRDLAQTCSFFCELGAIYMVGGEIGTIAVAGLALILAIVVRRGHFHTRFAIVLISCSVAGALIMLWDLLASTTVEGSRYALYTFQFWMMRPLIIWPSIGIVLALAAGVVAKYGWWPRALQLGAPVIAALLSLYFASYLLPATDARVAGLHGMGVVELPAAAGILTRADGQQIVRDRDPFFFRKERGYLAVVSPGDYSLDETCVQGFTVLGPPKVRSFHVALGATTVVPDLCPHQP